MNSPPSKNIRPTDRFRGPRRGTAQRITRRSENCPWIPAAIDLTAIDAFLATLTPGQATELPQRCVVITENSASYDEPTVNLCTAVVEGAEAEMAPEPAPAAP